MQKWQYMWLEIRRWTEYKSRGGFLSGVEPSPRFELTIGDRVLKDQEVFDYIDHLGLHGWELVSASAEVTEDFAFGHSLWFKRPLIAAPPPPPAPPPDQLSAEQWGAQVDSEPGVTDQFETGDRVRHRTFGEGIVVESKVAGDGEKEVTVVFEEEGIKHLLASFAKLEKLEG